VIPIDRKVSTVTKEEWIASTSVEQRAFNSYWQNKGIAWFNCLRCGYPTAYGQVGCDACRGIASEWEARHYEENKAKRQCPKCKGVGEVEGGDQL